MQAGSSALREQALAELPGDAALDGLWKEWAQAKQDLRDAVEDRLQKQERLISHLARGRGRERDGEWASPESATPFHLPNTIPGISKGKIAAPNRQSGPGGLRNMVQFKTQDSLIKPAGPAGSEKLGQIPLPPADRCSSFTMPEVGCENEEDDDGFETIDSATGFDNDRRLVRVSRKPNTTKDGALAYWEAIVQCNTWWRSLEEPPRFGLLPRVLRTTAFTCLCASVILMDTVFTAYSANYAMQDPFADTTTEMKAIEIGLLCFYGCELLAKLSVHRQYFFCNQDWGWNIFDFILVLQGMFDMILTYLASGGDLNATFIRILRLMKIGKILRLFRAVRILNELRVMFQSIINSFTALFWAFVMLTLILYVFALTFVQSMTSHVMDNDATLDPLVRADITKYFGSVQEGLLSLYMCTSGGTDWLRVYRLVSLGGPLYAILFIFFVGFFNFAVLNILTGIFMEKAMAASQPDRESAALEQRRAEDADVDALKAAFDEMDEDGSGLLTAAQLTEYVKDEMVKKHLRWLGLETHDAVMFFNVLISVLGEDQMPIDEFVERCSKMKGNATALDLHCLAFEVSIIRGLMREPSSSTRPSTISGARSARSTRQWASSSRPSLAPSGRLSTN